MLIVERILEVSKLSKTIETLIVSVDLVQRDTEVTITVSSTLSTTSWHFVSVVVYGNHLKIGTLSGLQDH